jgi:carboxyl-terminal processing protease
VRRRPAILAAVLASLLLAGASFLAGVRMAERADPEGLEQVVAAAEDIAARSVRPISQRELIRAAIEGMLRLLDDPYAMYLDPVAAQEARDIATGSFVGIGVWLRPHPEGLEVTSLLPGSPAREAGIVPGDVLAAADGHPLRGLSAAEAGRFIRGPEGSAVTLAVRSGGGERTVEVERARIAFDDVQARMTAPRVAHARVAQIGAGVADRLRGSLEELLAQGAQGVVLDLRGNPGGLAEEAAEVVGLFVEDGVVARFPEGGTLEARGEALPPLPLAVLVDGRTASAAELVAGAIQDHERGVIVGTRTFGKGAVLSVSDLAEGAAVQFTTGQFLTPDGHEVEGRGISPDAEVPPGGPTDAQLERAVEIVISALEEGEGG